MEISDAIFSGLEKSFPAVPPELRETVFANAVDIVLADGTVEEEERQFIDDLGSKLEVDKKRAKAIVQVMVYKNHGCQAVQETDCGANQDGLYIGRRRRNLGDKWPAQSLSN